MLLLGVLGGGLHPKKQAHIYQFLAVLKLGLEVRQAEVRVTALDGFEGQLTELLKERVEQSG